MLWKLYFFTLLILTLLSSVIYIAHLPLLISDILAIILTFFKLWGIYLYAFSISVSKKEKRLWQYFSYILLGYILVELLQISGVVDIPLINDLIIKSSVDPSYNGSMGIWLLEFFLIAPAIVAINRISASSK